MNIMNKITQWIIIVLLAINCIGTFLILSTYKDMQDTNRYYYNNINSHLIWIKNK